MTDKADVPLTRCDECNGSGKRFVDEGWPPGICADCNGLGLVPDKTTDPIADGKGEERRVFVLYERDEHLPGVEVRVGFHAGPARDWRPMAGSFADGHAAESCVVAFVERREPTAREKLGAWLSEYAFRKWGLWETSGPPESRYTVDLYSGPQCVASVNAESEDAAIESALRKCGAE